MHRRRSSGTESFPSALGCQITHQASGIVTNNDGRLAHATAAAERLEQEAVAKSSPARRPARSRRASSS